MVPPSDVVQRLVTPPLWPRNQRGFLRLAKPGDPRRSWHRDGRAPDGDLAVTDDDGGLAPHTPPLALEFGSRLPPCPIPPARAEPKVKPQAGPLTTTTPSARIRFTETGAGSQISDGIRQPPAVVGRLTRKPSGENG